MICSRTQSQQEKVPEYGEHARYRVKRQHWEFVDNLCQQSVIFMLHLSAFIYQNFPWRQHKPAKLAFLRSSEKDLFIASFPLSLFWALFAEVNTSRGGLVDNKALIQGLHQGHWAAWVFWVSSIEGSIDMPFSFCFAVFAILSEKST